MILSPESDRRAGLTVYGSPGLRFQVKLRERDEDFQVEEIIDLTGVSSEPCDGCVPVYRVEKRGIDTLHMAKALGEALRSKVNFAGLKDKKAFATQYVSARSSRAKRPEFVDHPFFKADRVGFAPRPLGRRSILGNRFKIVIRGAVKDIKDSIEQTFAHCQERRIPNFFGYQRFGLKGLTTHRAGREIVKRDFEGAIRIILCEPRTGEGPLVKQAREAASKGRYQEALANFTIAQDIERNAVRRLVEHQDNFLGALRSIPVQVRRFFVHAYQSYLFNLTLSKAIESKMELGKVSNGDNWSRVDAEQLNAERVHGVNEAAPEDAIPMVQLVGYAFRDYGSRFDSIMRKVLREEEVDPKHFYIKEAEEMSSEGGFRHAPLLAKDLRYHIDANYAELEFALGRGEYATTLVREIVKPDDPLSSGF